MTETHDELEVASNGHNGSRAGSVIESLREVRANYRTEHYYDVAIPGYRRRLYMRLVPLSSQQIAVLRRRHEKSRAPERDLAFSSDVLITACEGMLGKPSPDGELGLLEDENGNPYRIDVRLAEAFNMPTCTTARQVLDELFSAAPSPVLAIQQAANGYSDWASEVNEEIDDGWTGE